jgi:hypothetical protein
MRLPATRKTKLKWVLLVAVNTIVAWYFALELTDSLVWILGILSGIFCWWFAYVFLDSYLIKRDRLKESKNLMISAYAKSLLQCVVVIDKFLGINAMFMAGEFLKLFFGHGRNIFNRNADSPIYSFLSSYLTTLLMGLFYSIIVLVIFLMLRYIFSPIREYFKRLKSRIESDD